jgi:hypothetical protein
VTFLIEEVRVNHLEFELAYEKLQLVKALEIKVQTYINDIVQASVKERQNGNSTMTLLFSSAAEFNHSLSTSSMSSSNNANASSIDMDIDRPNIAPF